MKKWKIYDQVPDAAIGYRAIIDEEGFTVCDPSPMGEANARLIAAAPDLLAAAKCALADLQGLIGDLYEEHPAHKTEVELRAAIDRAEGETV